MKKNFLFVLFFTLIFNISICSAAKNLSDNSFAIGGIFIGGSADYIKGIYGEPNKIIKNQNEQNAETWYYGETFVIYCVDGIANSIVSSGANGLATPEGISVGMKKRQMTSKYGRPNHSDKFGNRAIYTYQTNKNLKMIFIVLNGMISEIRINQG